LDTERVGLIGLPFPGVELKMVPCGSKYELRLRGVNVTPGYFGQPDLTKKMFDEEGFYCIGDAGIFVDDADPGEGHHLSPAASWKTSSSPLAPSCMSARCAPTPSRLQRPRA